MNPVLGAERWVFCTLAEDPPGLESLNPLLRFQENEGLTLILRKEQADSAGLEYSGVWSRITISVHSSLEAVGLLAAITGALADASIPCNAVSAYYHDHLFVPESVAEQALKILERLAQDDRAKC